VIFIAHRGNVYGPDKINENNPCYLTKALDQGFDVEVDLNVRGRKLLLGHPGGPFWKLRCFDLHNPHVWIHAKSIDAAYECHKRGFPRWFYHEDDAMTLTSNGYLWTYPGEDLTPHSICVLPEKYNDNWRIAAGICSDIPLDYRRIYEGVV
jgi:hypothetical protein